MYAPFHPARPFSLSETLCPWLAPRRLQKSPVAVHPTSSNFGKGKTVSYTALVGTIFAAACCHVTIVVGPCAVDASTLMITC